MPRSDFLPLNSIYIKVIIIIFYIYCPQKVKKNSTLNMGREVGYLLMKRITFFLRKKYVRSRYKE